MILLDKIIENIIQLKFQDNIREIYLFGSVARGDQDEQSDVDILIVIDDCSEDDYIKYKKEYASILQIPVSIRFWPCRPQTSLHAPPQFPHQRNAPDRDCETVSIRFHPPSRQ